MNTDHAHALAERFAAGDMPVDDFLRELAKLQTATLDDAQIDLDRARRCGLPEVIYAAGKSIATLAAIVQTQLETGHEVLATRVSNEQAAALQKTFPQARFNEIARAIRVGKSTGSQKKPAGRVAVISAGTSDRTVAEEARETAEWTGADVRAIADVGVAGPQRLLKHLPEIRDVDSIVVVAGMEGALPSVVGGHVACPVIAVPTSVGYGASFGGVAALLGMLNSCASNVTVVNIDAGFKGGYVAGLIANRAAEARESGRVHSDSQLQSEAVQSQ